MKFRLKKFLLNFPGFEGLCRFLTRRHVRALMYHRFHGEGDSRAHGVGRAELRTHLNRIHRHHDIITPSEHLEVARGAARGYCPVVITVDDGYEDFHRVAYPLFRDAGVPVMLFVTTGFVSGDMWFWWDRLAYILNQASPGERDFTFDSESFRLTLGDLRGRNLTWHELADRCRFFSDEEKEALILALSRDLEVALPATAPGEFAAVDWNKIREMADGGILYGAHTINHPILTRIGPGSVARELAGSREQLETELGSPVTWFCYPQGGPADYDDRIKGMVAQHFEGCYLSFQALQSPPDAHAMPRYGVPGDLLEFRWMLCGAEYIVLKLKSLLGRPVGVPESYWKGSHEHHRAGI